jgi:hypothetical protein
VCACPYRLMTPKWWGQWAPNFYGRFRVKLKMRRSVCLFFGLDPRKAAILKFHLTSYISFPHHISVAINARLFIFWWYDGHSTIVPFGTFNDFWPTLGPIGGTLWKSTFGYISWTLLASKIMKLLLLVGRMRLHPIIPVFLIWPTFQGHRGQIA